MRITIWLIFVPNITLCALPKGKFELNKDMNVDDKYRNVFFNKELVKISYLLHELKNDKYTKFILRHLANDNIQKGVRF